VAAWNLSDTPSGEFIQSISATYSGETIQAQAPPTDPTNDVAMDEAKDGEANEEKAGKSSQDSKTGLGLT